MRTAPIKFDCYFYGEKKNTDYIRKVCKEHDIMFDFKRGGVELLYFKEGELQATLAQHGNTVYFYPDTNTIEVR